MKNKNEVSAQKIYQPGYKVRRLGGGLYLVQSMYNGSAIVSQTYINRIRIGSQSFYRVNGAPLFPTLRDAICHIVYG